MKTKEKLARAGSSASYDRKCLHLTEEEVARKLRAGEKHTVRFNVSTFHTSREWAFMRTLLEYRCSIKATSQ